MNIPSDSRSLVTLITFYYPAGKNKSISLYFTITTMSLILSQISLLLHCALIQAKSCTVRFQPIVNYHFHVAEMIEIRRLLFGDTSVVFNLKKHDIYVVCHSFRSPKKNRQAVIPNAKSAYEKINVTLLLFYCYFMLN